MHLFIYNPINLFHQRKVYTKFFCHYHVYRRTLHRPNEFEEMFFFRTGDLNINL